MTVLTDTSAVSLRVMCLCAAWCGVCREFEAAFTELARAWPQAVFEWVDVEDDPRVEALDVENFPTILIGVAGEPVFFGPILPHIQMLERMLQGVSDLKALGHLPETPDLRQVLASAPSSATLRGTPQR